MFRKYLISAVLFLFSGSLFAYQPLAWQNGQFAPMELSLFGGVASSQTEKNFQGVDMEFGGGGFAAGLSVLNFVNNYFGAGFDFTYANDGYGKTENISGADIELSVEHFTPLLLTKTYLLPPSTFPLSVYVPLGAGMDFAKIRERTNGSADDKKSDTLSGFALMAGLGAELSFRNNTFIALEGRYNWSYYLGGNNYDLSRAENFVALFKVGMKFDYGYEFLD